MEGKASDWRPGPTVCRCCLSEGCYKDISTEYFWMGKREVYSEMLSETLNVSIAYSQSGGPNSNSRLICEPCISRLRDASEFKRQVVDCEKTFMHHLDPGTSSKSREFAVESVGEVKIEVVKQEKDSISDDDFDDRPDFLDVDSDDDLDDQPLTKLASKIPKKESVDLLQLLDTSQITVKRKANLKLKAPPKKIVKKEVKPTASKAAPAKQAEKKKGIDEPPHESREDIMIRRTKKQIAKHSMRARRKRVLLLLECSRICLFKRKKSSYICIYCNQGYEDPAKLRDHNTEHDNVKIVEIERAIGKMHSTELFKADITNVNCKLCDTPIDKLNDLITHLVERHNKRIDRNLDNGILPFKMNLYDFKCAICSEEFTNYKTLNHHMNVHYPKFVCEQCGSGFVTAMRLKSHVITHETGSYSCNECDKVFCSKNAVKSHYEYIHMKVKKHSCSQCSETFLLYHQKLKHITSAHGVNLEKFNCNFCSKTFSTRGYLGRHIRELHLKERRHTCNMCDAKFYGKSGLTKHMVTHTGERNHHCRVCQKSYGRREHLVTHMRTHSIG